MKYKALIFDVDGTLADNERHGHRVAFNAAFQRAGLDWVWDETLYGALLKTPGGKERIEAFAARWRPGWPANGMRTEAIAALHRQKTEIYGDMLAISKANSNLFGTIHNAECGYVFQPILISNYIFS